MPTKKTASKPEPPPSPATEPQSARRPKQGDAPLSTRLSSLEASLAPVIAAVLAAQRDANPTLPVANVLLEGRKLVIPAREHRAALLEADVEPLFLDQLETRLDYLEAAESRWASLRDAGPDEDLAAKRAACDAHRRHLTRYARRFLRRDPKAMAYLDAVAEGTGDADLCDDLQKLADLYDKHPDRLPSKGQPRDVATRARALARAFTAALEGAKSRVDPTTARLARNVAFALAMEAAREVSEGGQFAFEETDPGTANRFKLTLRRSASNRAEPAAPPAPPSPPSPPAG